MSQVINIYVEGMTEEKLKLKCVTGGKHHRPSRTFHFECDDLHHQFVIKRIYHSSVALRFSTNAIESLNRSIKQFLGLGYLDFRETILRENNIFNILKKFESLTQSEKITSLQFHLLEIGTLTKKLLVRNISIVCRHLPKLKLSKLNYLFV